MIEWQEQTSDRLQYTKINSNAAFQIEALRRCTVRGGDRSYGSIDVSISEMDKVTG
jgi:hypothetical protein